MPSILVADDHANIRSLMATYLVRAGYQVHPAVDGEEALEILDHAHIDLLIVDVMMPRLDGYSLTRALREAGYALPILMITAKERIEDKTLGFQAGTDDYMVKPIDFDEMLLRVSALLRRARIVNEHRIVIGETILESDSLTVRTPEGSIALPPKEFFLLFKLLSYPQKIFTRRDLMDEIWGMDHDADERTVDVHIKRLRERFEHLPDFKIVTIRGLGYKAEKAR